MKRYPRIYGIIFLTTLLFGCGGGDGTKSNDAALANLILEGATLDQLFQSSQFEYTADVNFLAASVTVTAKTSDANARVMINDTSGDTAVIPLAEGPNYIDILVTAEDGASRTDYSVAVSRAALGSFSQQAYLKASNPDASDRLGRSVAVQGETLVVGTPYESSNAVDGESDNSLYHSGAAYVFTRSAGVWTQQAYLKASNPGDRDGFGTSVAIDGDTLIVGADEGTIGGEATVLGPGMVYVFTRSDNTWTEQTLLKSSNAESSDDFGASVSIHGETLVVGAPDESSSANGGESDNSAQGAGAVYVFIRDANGWIQQAYLKASNAEEYDYFGSSVAIHGDTLVVGAPEEDSAIVGDEDDNSGYDVGAAYVFSRSGGIWTQQAYLKGSHADGGADGFGASVAIDGDTVVVGDSFGGRTGGAYVFTRDGDSWTQQAYLKASNAEEFDYFGGSVDIDRDTLVVGAVGEDSSALGGEADNSAPGAGAVYVYTRRDGSWTQQAYLKASNAETDEEFDYRGQGDFFGSHVAIDGDTLVIGATGEDGSGLGDESDNSVPDSGAVYVWQ